MKSDDFDFDIINFPILDGDVPHTISYVVFISELIRFGFNNILFTGVAIQKYIILYGTVQLGYSECKQTEPLFCNR